MIKMIATICRRPGMTHAGYAADVRHVRSAVATEEPVAPQRYVQSHVFDPAFGAACDRTHPVMRRATQTVPRPSQAFFLFTTEVPIFQQGKQP